MIRPAVLSLLLLAGCAGQSPPPVASAPEPPPSPPPICANPNLEGPMLTFSTPVVQGQAVSIAAVGDVLMHDPLQAYAAEQPDGFRALLARVTDVEEDDEEC